MRKVIFRSNKDREEEQERLKNTDRQLRIDQKVYLSSKLAQMPIRDLSIINFITENELRKYYIGKEEFVDYNVVEFLLDMRSQIPQSIHCISSFDDALYMVLSYKLPDIPFIEDKNLLPLVVASDILNITEQDLQRMARNDASLYEVRGNIFIDVGWMIRWYKDGLENMGFSCGVYIRNSSKGKVELLIERDLNE